MGEKGRLPGHVFISYVRENSHEVDSLQRVLELTGIKVWRDKAKLWPGDYWRGAIRKAITQDALVFIACFSRESATRRKSYQNEELKLAVDEIRLRRVGEPWLIPVRLNDCEIPDVDIGGGNTLRSIHWVDLFGADAEANTVRLVEAVRRILMRNQARTADDAQPASAADVIEEPRQPVSLTDPAAAEQAHITRERSSQPTNRRGRCGGDAKQEPERLISQVRQQLLSGRQTKFFTVAAKDHDSRGVLTEAARDHVLEPGEEIIAAWCWPCRRLFITVRDQGSLVFTTNGIRAVIIGHKSALFIPYARLTDYEFSISSIRGMPIYPYYELYNWDHHLHISSAREWWSSPTQDRGIEPQLVAEHLYSIKQLVANFESNRG